MKRISIAVLALALTACASDPVAPVTHETTTMDRELALKLADRPTVIVAPAAPAPVVNVNNYNGGTQAVASHGPWEKFQPQEPADDGEDTRTQCIESPVYSTGGVLLRTQRRCFGGR